MKTILKATTASTALLLALVTGACGNDTDARDPGGAEPREEPAAAVPNGGTGVTRTPLRHYDSCRMTKAEFMTWIAAGTPQKNCVVDGYRPAVRSGDDRRRPVG